MTASAEGGVGHLLRDLAPQVLGAVARRSDDFAAAEDAVQEALIAAASRWPAEGLPRNPRGWLYHAALRRLTDQVRSEMARRRREEAVAGEVWAEWAFVPPPEADPGADHDDTLALLFNRVDLSGEAIRLARLLRALLPGDAEVAGLLALMLLTDARRAARTGSMGELIPLDEQDRSLWDRRLIDEGVALASQALTSGPAGWYEVQAAIAAVHDEAADAEATDWPQILALYEMLKGMSDNPMVSLNHAIAAAMVHGPAAGLELLAALDRDRRLAGYRLDAVRRHLLERAGDREAALARYRAAAEGTASVPERNFLLTRAARLNVGDVGQ